MAGKIFNYSALIPEKALNLGIITHASSFPLKTLPQVLIMKA